MIFSDRLKEERLEKKLTQKTLASSLGLSPNCICEWEKGRSEPSLESLKKLSQIFECSIDYLIGNTDDFGNVVVHGSPTAELGAGEKDLLQNFRKLPEDLRHRAQAYMKKLVELTEEEISDTFARR